MSEIMINRKKYKFKITGSGPTGLILALSFSKMNADIFIYDLLDKDKLIDRDKTYAITHSSRIILEEFDIWHKLEEKLSSFDSLSITDTFTSSSAVFNLSDLDKDIRGIKKIGWVLKHSDLTEILFRELENFKNIHFNSYENTTNNSFDFEFIAYGANHVSRKKKYRFIFNHLYGQSCLTFKALIRGLDQERAYEIFRKEGPLALLPLNKDIYQVIWTDSNQRSIDKLNTKKSLLLDNLSTILPSQTHVDQIIGDLNIFPVSLSLNFNNFKVDKSLYLGDAFHTFHPVGGQGLNACWRDVYQIYRFFNNRKINKFSFYYLKLNFIFKRFLDIFSLIIVTDSLIRLFANNNILFFPLRKISFFILNKFKFVRKIILNYMTKSLIYFDLK